MFYAIYGIAQHWVLFMTDRGLTAATAARLLTIYYSLGVIGRFVWGPLFDKYSSKGVGLTLTTIMATMVALLTFGGEGTRSIPYLYAIIFGFCYGGFIFMKPLLIAEYFGTQSLGKILGVASAITAFLSSLAPAITGFLFDLTKSYHLSFVVATAMAFFAVLMLATVRNEYALMRKE
jgi:MFS family permease